MAHTDKQTDGHGDSRTDPAQRAESVKSLGLSPPQELAVNFFYSVRNTITSLVDDAFWRYGDVDHQMT